MMALLMFGATVVACRYLQRTLLREINLDLAGCIKAIGQDFRRAARNKTRHRFRGQISPKLRPQD